MQKKGKKPSWLKKEPQTPLEVKLKGKRYNHFVFCSASRFKPLGSSGCICLKLLKKAD